MTARFRLLFVTVSCLLPSLGLAQSSSSDLAPAERYHIRLEYRWFSTQLEGEALRAGAGIEGTRFDVKTDLGMEDDRTWEGRGTIRFSSKFKFRGSYTALDYKGTSTLEQRIVFSGTSFNRGEETSSSLKGAYYSADLEWDFLARSAGFIGVIAGARAPDVDVVVVAPASGKRVTDTFRPVCPVLGLAFRGYLGRISLDGAFSTFAKVQGRKTTDLEVGLRLHFTERAAISGGYRSLSFNAEDEQGLADFKVKGWTYGIEIGL